MARSPELKDLKETTASLNGGRINILSLSSSKIPTTESISPWQNSQTSSSARKSSWAVPPGLSPHHTNEHNLPPNPSRTKSKQYPKLPNKPHPIQHRLRRRLRLPRLRRPRDRVIFIPCPSSIQPPQGSLESMTATISQARQQMCGTKIYFR